MIVYASSMLQNAPKSTAKKALRGTSDKDARFDSHNKDRKRIKGLIPQKKKKKHQVRTQLRREKSIQEGESNSFDPGSSNKYQRP